MLGIYLLNCACIRPPLGSCRSFLCSDLFTMANKARSRSQFSSRDRNTFTINVKIEATDEVFPLKNVYSDMKISELKDYMEFATGIPINMQRISYLDEGDLLEHMDIRSNDIVPGATLLMRVWSQWRDLLEAVAANDDEWVFSLGVTHPSDYKTPNSEYMIKRSRRAWYEERAFVALCIAAHRGHDKLCAKLIQAGANLNGTSPLGRTALHVAAAQGHGHIVDLLLEKGANIDAEDDDGNNALTIADKFGHKSCERHLFLFRWQQRAKKLRPSRQVPLKPHQYYDSKFPVWVEGGQCQLYLTNIAPPEEFEGTALNSPIKRPHPGVVRRNQFHLDDTGDRPQVRISDNDEAQPAEHAGKKLPAIQSVDAARTQKLQKAYAFYIKNRRGDLDLSRHKPPTFEQWLNKIQDKEKKHSEAKRKAREMKRQEEEESAHSDSDSENSRWRKMEEDKATNYENWLAQKEAERKKASPSPKDALKSASPDKRGGSAKQRSAGALRLYLRSLGNDRAGQPYENWLIKKEMELLDRAKSGDRLFSF
ncbi:ankyrin repeat, SAM and basic leucine zipper domain-containing protein 1-like isoform X1 [Haliotis rufescens]|uniref:ankyrin repeat, SAM and basic leucine zipper domain-containing protein 1-like isoform X1 n=1 Tax=Haliotis rufescens TaxID=6454 RepID=UPI00201F0C77|nr:ankyrin repeat, SAM and basic leucine zipper domain-containing protein 1-like isoform X1 [Haliotis rufescens]